MGENTSFQVLNISDILPNRFQPRIKFEDEALDELAESISRFGVIEPIVVRPIGNKYEIIAGERRYKASKLASKTTIPSIVINLSDKDSEELALLENVQRQSLNPIEEAVSYKRILDMGYITREELSKKIGKPQSVILNKTRLLNLADEVQSYLLNNKISERHARALLNITDLDDQVEMLHRIVNERLTVKKTNKEIRNYIENNKDDETETLFDDERGNDKVDIDKIMREAQDINPENNVSAEAPDLMAASPAPSPVGVNQVFESTPINNDSAITQEPSKFVNVQPSTGAPSDMNNMTNNGNGVTFDSMFNGPMAVQTPVSESSTGSEPILNTNTSINSEPISAPVLNPESSIPPINNSEVVSPEPVVNSASTINDEISSIVSDALKNQPVDNQGVTPPLSNIPDFSINTPVNSEVNQAPTTVEPVNNAGMFDQSGTLQSNDALASNPVPVVETPAMEQVNNIPNASLNNLDGTLINNVSEVSPIPQADNSTQQVSVTNNIPDYAGIVQKLREFADEIEKNGHFVNLEEVDLGNQYKVIFTFDK